MGPLVDLYILLLLHDGESSLFAPLTPATLRLGIPTFQSDVTKFLCKLRVWQRFPASSLNGYAYDRFGDASYIASPAP